MKMSEFKDFVQPICEETEIVLIKEEPIMQTNMMDDDIDYGNMTCKEEPVNKLEELDSINLNSKLSNEMTIVDSNEVVTFKTKNITNRLNNLNVTNDNIQFPLIKSPRSEKEWEKPTCSSEIDDINLFRHSTEDINFPFFQSSNYEEKELMLRSNLENKGSTDFQSLIKIKQIQGRIKTHTRDKPYRCNFCDKSFSQGHNLTDHTRTHTGDKPFKCNLCNKRFYNAHNLKVHFKTHTGDKPYKCNLCQSSFTQQTHLTYHIRTHTGEKPYKCDICYKFFACRQTLTCHTRMHTGDKPYKCDVCAKCFSRRHHLTAHAKTHN